MEPSENQHSLNEYGVAGGKKKEVCQPSPENKKPPDLSFKLKKAGDVPKSTEILRNDHLPIDILLLTSVESCDFLSCFSLLDQPFKCYKKEIGVVYFGRVGDVSDQEKLKVALINCSKGAAAPGGSLTVVLNAVHVLQPKAVFLVGTCISLGLEKARMGDVVISSKLTTAEGFKTPGSPLLGNLVRDAPYGWIAPLKNPDECEIKVHCNGDILSQSLREKCQNVNICEQYPTAVAIETEGEGVYAAAYDSNVEWVIVKGVASYFHQSQSATSEWMSFASTMAASVVAKILNHSAVFREWPHYNQGVEHTSLDRAYSSLRSGDLESAISAQATVQHREADCGTLHQGASLMTSNRLASTMASQPRIKENRGKRPLHPSVTTTLERKRQNTDIPERVDYATLDQGYSSLRSGHLESAVGAQAMIQRRGVDCGTSDQGASLLTSNRLSSTIGSHTRIRENHGKRPLHPLKTTVQERQRQIKNIAARVDHGTSDQGASLLTSNGLASAMGSQFRRKENHGKRPVHPLETATPEKQRQNPDFPETDIDISKVVELLKREYNRRADFSPLLWSKGMKLQLKEVYTSVRVVSRRKAGSWEIDVDDIFGSSEEDNDPLVLVEGSPGIGKTTFCLKLAHDWANGAMPRTFPSFKLVFLLKCRDMEGDVVKDVVEEIFEQLLPEDLKEKTKEALVNFLEDLDNQKQILILLDGLDELPEKSEHRVNKVLGRKKLSFCYLLATTRQEKGIDTRKQFKFDIFLAIEGFSEENSFEYTRKHFRNIGTEHSSKGERLIEEIKQNHLLRDLQSNPLNLLLLCVVYEDHEGSLPSSFTDLYQTIVRCLLRRYCAREELKASEKDGDLDKQFEITILAIGELAWKCLLNDHLSFYEDELEEVERNNENIVARRLGLVYKEESLKRLKPRHAYSFLHRTFQEYLAASYIAHKFRGSEFQVLKQMLFPEIARRKFKQVFVFVCGILREEANILFEHIGNMLQKQWDWLKCDMSTAHFFVDSWKETGNAERMAKTLCSFLRFPRSLHLWNEEQCDALCYVLKKCSEFSEVVTFAEVHVAEDVEFKSTYYELESTRYVSSLLELPYVKSVIIYGELRLIDYKALVKRLDKTLVEKLTFALCADIGEGVSKFPDFGFSSVRVRICGSLGSSLLQDVENLLLHKRLSSLSITVCGDVQESLVEGLARGLAGESAVKFFDLCINGNLSFHGAYLLEKGILRNRSLRNVKVSVNGEPPENWQVVAKNLCAQFAEKAIVSAIYPNTFSKVKDTQVTHLNRFLSKTDLEQQTVTLNVWGELSGDGCKAVYEVLLHSPVSPLTVNIHAQLTDEILRCTASCVEEQEKLSSITINAWFEMTEKETKLIKELGLDKNASFLLNVNGTSAHLKESIIDSKVISSDERQSGFAFFEKATKGPSKSTERSPHKSLRLTFSYDGDMSSEWEHDLGEGLAGNSSLKSLTLQIYNFGDTRKDWGRGLGEGLLRNTSLKSLELEFDNYGDTSKEWRRGLDEGLVQNTSLESLIMKVDNLSLESLIMEMNNPSLISLGTIYNYRGRGLCEGLARNTSLKSLTLQIHSHGDKSNEWGRGLGEGLARNTSLKSLTLQIHSHSDKSNEWVRGLGEGLATNTSLKSLTLQIAGYGDTSKEWGRGLFEGLARNTSLESLTIKINIYGDVSNEWEHGLGEGLARNSSLESLTVKINNYGDVSNEWEHGLGEGLTRNSSLKSLTLQIHSHGDKSNQWGRGLGQGLARNSSLKSLALQIDDCSNTSKEWGRGLGKGLARNTSLESLTMIISNHGDVSNEWKHGLGEGLARNTSLKSLALQIDDYGDTSKEWGRGLDEGLARNTSLESLTIKINKGGHTNYEWEQGLGEGLAGNTSLKSLTLEIYTYGSKEWGRGLGEGLARNTSLESLTIKINNDSDTSDEWEHNYGDVSNEWEHGLGEGLGGNCSLKSLTLQINNYGDTSKESGRGLGEGLLKNTSLNSLTLTINNYSYMSDEWGVRFAEGLARNTSLKSVTLTMNNYFYMSSVWGLGVFEGSVRNTSLKSITLAINNYGDMKGEWGHGLVEGLARNMSLKSLTLAINNYGDMNGEWEHGLVEGLARNTSLNSLTLKISNYCYMSHVWRLGLAEGLARNTSLNSLTLAANNYGDMSEWGCAFREGLTKSKSLTECDLIVNICGTC